MRRTKRSSTRGILGWGVVLVLTVAWFAQRQSMSGRSVELSEGVHASSVERQGAPSRKAMAGAVPQGVELPACSHSEFLIHHAIGRYTLYYDTAARQARWVAYMLTRNDVEGRGVKRTNHFVPDSVVLSRGWATACNDDYLRSGYDRGHLLPSADRNDSEQENRMTFLYSNVSPQKSDLNHGVWRLLEEQVRRWAKRFDTVYVVTGGDWDGSQHCIGHGVKVPGQFFKAVLRRSCSTWQVVAFLIPNRNRPDDDFYRYAVSVDQVERQVKLDLFASLPDSVEQRIESQCDLSGWQE